VTDPREARLPKWAQGELADLRRTIRDLREDFEEYADKALDEDRHVVVAKPYDTHPIPVGFERDVVRFYLDGFGGFRWLDVSVRDGVLDLTGATGLRLTPHASNHLTASLDRD
jgi:hypothetical protein